MGLSNMKPRTKTWRDDYRLEFWNNDFGGGYSFEGDLDSEGRFTMKPLDNEFAEANFLMACERQAQVTWKHSEPVVRSWDTIKIINEGWWVTTPARGTCACGNEVRLERDYGHGIDCDGCNRIYNQSGQELAPRSQWDDYYDEDSTQPYWAEFGYSDYEVAMGYDN